MTNQDKPLSLSEVVKNFLEKKSTFNLDSNEKRELYNLLMNLLTKLENEGKVTIIDINQIFVEGTAYYTITLKPFEALSYTQQEDLKDKVEIFINDFTDNDGIFISWVYMHFKLFQLNFRIS